MDILDPSYWEGLGMSAMAGWDRESVLSAVHESRSKDYLFPVGEGWKPEGFDEAMAQVGEQYGSPMEMARIGPHLAGLGVETGFRVAGSMWPAFLGGDRSPGDVWAEKKGQFADVWSGEADPSVGSIWPTLFATIGPDLLVPVSGIAMAPRAAHNLTRSGVRSLAAASTAAGKRLLLDAEKLAGSSGLSDEAVGYILDMTRNHTETAFDVIGGKAQLGLRVDEVMDVAGGTTKVVEDVGEAGRVLGVSDMAAMGRAEAAAARDAVAYARRGKVPLTADEAVEEVVLSFGRPGKPKLGPRVKPGFTEAGARTPLVPVHINLDEALTVTKGGGGRYVVNFHPEKADVLYASDRAARAATCSWRPAGATAARARARRRTTRPRARGRRSCDASVGWRDYRGGTLRGAGCATAGESQAIAGRGWPKRRECTAARGMDVAACNTVGGESHGGPDN